MLRDPTAFPAYNVDPDNPIQQRSFAVVDVSQEGNHRWSFDQLGGIIFEDTNSFQNLLFNTNCLLEFDIDTQLNGDHFGHFRIHGIGDACHDAFFQQDPLNLRRGHTGCLRQLADTARKLESDFFFPWRGGIEP